MNIASQVKTRRGEGGGTLTFLKVRDVLVKIFKQNGTSPSKIRLSLPPKSEDKDKVTQIATKAGFSAEGFSLSANDANCNCV